MTAGYKRVPVRNHNVIPATEVVDRDILPRSIEDVYDILGSMGNEVEGAVADLAQMQGRLLQATVAYGSDRYRRTESFIDEMFNVLGDVLAMREQLIGFVDCIPETEPARSEWIEQNLPTR